VRQLRTQYVQGIYRPKYYTVNFKSRLRLLKVELLDGSYTLAILVELFDVEYYRDLEMWVRDHSRS